MFYPGSSKPPDPRGTKRDQGPMGSTPPSKGKAFRDDADRRAEIDAVRQQVAETFEYETSTAKLGEYQDALLNGVPLDLIDAATAIESMSILTRQLMETNTYWALGFSYEDMETVKAHLDESLGEIKGHVNALNTFFQRVDAPAAGDVEVLNAFFKVVETRQQQEAERERLAAEERARRAVEDPMVLRPGLAVATASSLDGIPMPPSDTEFPIDWGVLSAGGVAVAGTVGAMARGAGAAWNFATSLGADPKIVMAELEDELAGLRTEDGEIPEWDAIMSFDADRWGMGWFVKRYLGLADIRKRLKRSWRGVLYLTTSVAMGSLIAMSGFSVASTFALTMAANFILRTAIVGQDVEMLKDTLEKGMSAEDSKKTWKQFTGVMYDRAEDVALRRGGTYERAQFRIRFMQLMRDAKEPLRAPRTRGSPGTMPDGADQLQYWIDQAWKEPIDDLISYEVDSMSENDIRDAMTAAVGRAHKNMAETNDFVQSVVANALLEHKGIQDSGVATEGGNAIQREIARIATANLDELSEADREIRAKFDKLDLRAQAQLEVFMGDRVGETPLATYTSTFLKTATALISVVTLFFGIKRVFEARQNVHDMSIDVIHQFIAGPLERGVRQPGKSMLVKQIDNTRRIAAYASEFAWYAMQKNVPKRYTKLIDVYEDTYEDPSGNTATLKRRRDWKKGPKQVAGAYVSAFMDDPENKKATSRCFCAIDAYLTDLYAQVMAYANYIDPHTTGVDLSAVQKNLSLAYKGKSIGGVMAFNRQRRTLSVMDLKFTDTDLLECLQNNYRRAMTMEEGGWMTKTVTRADPVAVPGSMLNVDRLNDRNFTGKLPKKVGLGLAPEATPTRPHFFFLRPAAAGLVHPEAEEDGVAASSAWHQIWKWKYEQRKDTAQRYQLKDLDARIQADSWCNPGTVVAPPPAPPPAPAPAPNPFDPGPSGGGRAAARGRNASRRSTRGTRESLDAPLEVLPRPVSVVDELFAKHQIRL